MNVVIFSGALGLALVASLLYVVVNFLKHLTHFDLAESRNAVVTQLVSWTAGVLVLWIFSRSDFSSGFGLTDAVILRDASFVNVLLGGLLLGSGASTLYDAKKAVDNSDTATTPMLTRSDVAPPS